MRGHRIPVCVPAAPRLSAQPVPPAAVERPVLRRPHPQQPHPGARQGRADRRGSLDLAHLGRAPRHGRAALWPHLGGRVMDQVSTVLQGAVGMASGVAALFFLRFWRQTRDSFFLFFAAAFAIDALARFVLGFAELSEETQPLVYGARLITFGLIIIAIIRKNRPSRG